MYFDPMTFLKVDMLEKGLEDRSEEVSADERQDIVKRVIAMFQAAKKGQQNVPEVYQSSGEWADYLAERSEFYQMLLAGDVKAVTPWLQKFWRNSLGAIVKEYAKYEQLVAKDRERMELFQTKVARNLLIWKDIFGCSMEVLRIPRVGNPWGLVVDGELVCPKATRFHAHATQIATLLKGHKDPVVMDIGAGYAGMSYFLLRDNPGLTIIDVDLPETLALAAYYLMAALPDGKFFLYGEGDIPQGAELTKYNAVLLPNFCFPQLHNESVDLCLNSFSLSEMPPSTNAEYIGQIQRITRRYFLHNNMDRSGVINRGFARIPASSYPVNPNVLGLIYKTFDLFHGHDGDYREFLYQRL